MSNYITLPQDLHFFNGVDWISIKKRVVCNVLTLILLFFWFNSFWDDRFPAAASYSRLLRRFSCCLINKAELAIIETNEAICTVEALSTIRETSPNPQRMTAIFRLNIQIPPRNFIMYPSPFAYFNIFLSSCNSANAPIDI